MIWRYPEYCERFRCSAGECSDSCCIGWEICIDPETTRRYSSVEGEFGEKLRKNISEGAFVLGEGERCPFLNERNLCDIYIQLGEDALCQICTDHPRYFRWFGGVKEGGVGLCCEEAAKLILSSPPVLAERIVPDEEAPDCDEELLCLLTDARRELTSRLWEGSLFSALTSSVAYAERLQEILDFGDLHLPDWEELPAASCNEAEWTEFFAEMEPFDPQWPDFLRRCAELKNVPEELSPEQEEQLRRIGAYFLFRYFLGGVFDGEIYSRVKLAAVSVRFIGWLWRCRLAETGSCTFEDCVQISKAYSKEIEYSEENLERLLDAAYDRPIFGCI